MGEVLKNIKVIKAADIQSSTASIGSAEIESSAIGTQHIGAGAVGSAGLADGAVVAAKLGAGAVGSTALATGAVGSAYLADNAVTGAKVANDGITLSTKALMTTGTSVIGTTETTVAHGLGATPAVVILTPRSNAVIWESTAADGTNLKLTASAAGTIEYFVTT